MWETLKAIAPTVASAMVGPMGGAFVAAIGSILGDDKPTVTSIAKAITDQKLTPDQIVQLKQLEEKAKQDERDNGFRYAELEFKEDQAYLSDTQDARHAHSQNQAVFWLGVATVIAFAILMGLLLAGCYAILTDGLKINDPGTVAVVFSLVGTITGYLASNAQQVYNYFFGSSRGSQDKTNALAAAVSQFPKAVK